MNLNQKILELYPEYHTVHGPYVRKTDRRKIVILYAGTRRTTRLLAKVKLEIKIGRRLRGKETVDHKDEDPTNDCYSNLQVLSRAENASKSSIGNTYALGFKQSKEQKRNGDKNGKAQLTNKQVRMYRKLFNASKIRRKEICVQSGLSDRSIRNMLRGVSYVEAGGPFLKKLKVGRPKLL